MANLIRVLIADDSAFMRYTLSNQLASDESIEVVGTARDGLDALEKVRRLKPDVVTLDVEMPRMDGLAALSAIMEQAPVPVIMVSSLTAQGAETTVRALTAGAVDFITKPSNGSPIEIHRVKEELVAKVKAAAGSRLSSLRRRARPQAAEAAPPRKPRLDSGDFRKVVIIGSSTGGPKALYELIPHLPASLRAAVVVVQHMPEGFTKSLAERLDEVAQIRVKEAVQDDHLAGGSALVAPGDFHLLFDGSGRAQLSKGPRVHGLRPAVDVTMESLSRTYGSSCIAIVLTGMGSDGTAGTSLIKGAGGRTIVEDESTCVIFGMPKSVIEKGYADEVLPLPAVAKRIVELV